MPHLRECLADPDPEFRCATEVAVFKILDAQTAVELLLPLINDSEIVVRWNTCGLLHDLADRRAVEPLIRTMKSDPDPQVRGTAAYALGGIGDPSAIPALLKTLESDHETDELGYTPSGAAAGALDDILRTHHAPLLPWVSTGSTGRSTRRSLPSVSTETP